MKQEDSEILQKLGKEPGFKVPEHFFDDFSKSMMDKLPEVQITETDVKPSVWERVRPYVYMAAMFAGIWCMAHIFNHYNNSLSGGQPGTEMAEGAEAQGAGDVIIDSKKQDTGKMSYKDSVDAGISQTDVISK